MLTFPQIVEYYKKEHEFISPRLALMEYLQYELLDSLYKQKGSEQLSFMGGTAIRIGYHGNRFSEDLDFDNFGLSFKAFQEILDGVIKDMRLKGFVTEFRFIEKEVYHCHLKFPHILHAHKISDHASEKLLIKVETMGQTHAFPPRVFTLNKFDIFRDILLNPAEILLAQKLIAMVSRKRPKGRDFYDVSFLYGLTEPDMQYLENRTGLSRDEFVRQLLSRCEEFDFKALARETEPFLIRPDQKERVLHFLKFIRMKFHANQSE